MTKNYFAQQLGRLNKGVKKTLSPEQRATLVERANRMNALNAKSGYQNNRQRKKP